MSPAVDGTLRVVVDADTVKGPSDEQTSYLLGLLRRDEIDTYNYSDDGPPESQIRVVENWGDRYGVGWLLFEPFGDFNPETDISWDAQGSVSYSNKPPSYRNATVYGGDFLHIMIVEASGRLGIANNDPDQVRRDVTALLIADAASADLFVTDRPALVDLPSLPFWRAKCEACSG
jgi:hypothetical protein